MQAFGRIGRFMLLESAVAAVVAIVGHASDLGTLRLVAGIIAVVSLVNGVVFVTLQRRLFGNPRALARVAAEGLPATAVLTDVGSTSGRVGGNPIMKLGLNVNMMAVTLRSVVPIHKAHALQVGRTLPVKVDPHDPNVCVVDWGSVA